MFFHYPIFGGFFILIITASLWVSILCIRDFFHVKCPVCGNKVYYSKTLTRLALVREAAKGLDALILFIKEPIFCSPQKGGCGTDITGLRAAHPYVNDVLSKIMATRHTNQMALDMAKTKLEDTIP